MAAVDIGSSGVRIDVNLDTQLVTPPATPRIKAGAQAQIQIRFIRDSIPVGLDEDAQVSIAFKAKTGGGIVAYGDGFAQAAGPSYQAVVDFNDARLLALLSDRAQVELAGEILWAIGTAHFRSATFAWIAEAPVVTGPATAEPGPVYLPQSESDLRYAARESNLSDLADAEAARSNLGLGNVDNTADADKPVSTAQAEALAAKADLVSGKVPAEQLPGYVDDVVEVADFASLPVTGDNGKIYVTLNDGATWRWGGSAYVSLAAVDADARAAASNAQTRADAAPRIIEIGSAADRLTLLAPSQVRAGDYVREIGQGWVIDMTIVDPDVAGSYGSNFISFSAPPALPVFVRFWVDGQTPPAGPPTHVRVDIAANATQAQIATAIASAFNGHANFQGKLTASTNGAVVRFTGLLKESTASFSNYGGTWSTYATIVGGVANTRTLYVLNSESQVANAAGWGLVSEVLASAIAPSRLSTTIGIDKGGTNATTADNARNSLGIEQTVRWTPSSGSSGKWFRIINNAWWKKSGILSIAGAYSATLHAYASVAVAFAARAYSSNGQTIPQSGGSVLFSGQHTAPWFPSMIRIIGMWEAANVDVFIPSFSGTASELAFKVYEIPPLNGPSGTVLESTPSADPLTGPWDVAVTASGSGSSLTSGTYEVAVSATATHYASAVQQVAVTAGQNILVTWTRQTGDSGTRIWLRKVGDTNWSAITPDAGGSYTITSYTPGSSSMAWQAYTTYLDLTSANRALGGFVTSELIVQNTLGKATRVLSTSSSGFRAVQLPDANCALAGLVAVPASATAAGVPGSFAYDSSYFYTCVATNTWRRTPLASW